MAFAPKNILNLHHMTEIVAITCAIKAIQTHSKAISMAIGEQSESVPKLSTQADGTVAADVGAGSDALQF